MNMGRIDSFGRIQRSGLFKSAVDLLLFQVREKKNLRPAGADFGGGIGLFRNIYLLYTVQSAGSPSCAL